MKNIEKINSNFPFEDDVPFDWNLFFINSQFYKSFECFQNSSMDVSMDFSIKDLNIIHEQKGNELDKNKSYFVENKEKEEDIQKKIIIEIPKDESIIEEYKKSDLIDIYNINKIIEVKNNCINQNKIQKEKGILTQNDSKSTKNTTKFITKLFKNEINIKAKRHDCFSFDNLSKKIKNHFLNFCTDFSTDILKFLKDNYKDYNEIEEIFKEKDIIYKKFFKLNYKYKNIDSKRENDELKNKTLGDIINQDICSKFKNKNKLKNNQKLFEVIEKNELLKEFFSIKYNILFDIYYKNKYNIQLKQLNLDKTIVKKYQINENENIKLSSDIKMFKNLLENNSTCKKFMKKNNFDSAKKYKASLKNCAIKNYLLKAQFLLNE